MSTQMQQLVNKAVRKAVENTLLEKAELLAKEKQQADEKKGPAKSLPHFEKGVATCGQLATGLSLLMADLLCERVSTSIANSVCNAGGKMLKAVEMQQRYGTTQKHTGLKELKLIP